MEAYLAAAKKESFKEDEGAIMIDPDINIREKFAQIELPCNKEKRINNTFNAPVSTKDEKKRGPAVNAKVYESDATASEAEDNG